MAEDATLEGNIKTTVNRRRYLRLASAVGGSALLAGCIGGDDDGDGGDGGNGDNGTTTGDTSDGYNDVSLTFWHTEPETERASTIAAQIDKFVEQNDGISITVEPVDEEQIGPEAIASAQAGQMPNALMSPTRFTHLLGTNGFLDTSAHEEIVDRIGRDRFRDGPLQMTESDEGLYGVPHDCFIEVNWWRNSMFEDEGLEAPTNWDTLLTAAETLHNSDEDQYGISMGTGRNNITNQHFQQLALSHGAHLFSEEGEVTFNTPEMVEVLEFYGELAQYTPPGYSTSEDTYNEFLDELTYQALQTTYMLDDIYLSDINGGEEAALDDFSLNGLMEDGEGNQGTFALTQSFNVFSSGNSGIEDEQVSATVDLLEFLFEPDQYIPWLHLAPGGFQPTLSGITDMDEYQDQEILSVWDQQWQDEIASTIDSEHFAQFGFAGERAFPEVGNITGNYLPAEAAKAVIDGDDPQAVAEEYQTKMENALQ